MTNLLFFYGTLMKGHGRNSVVESKGLRFVGPAKIRGDFWSVGDSFPAFVDGPGEIVGEVWEAPTPEILADVLRTTDAIEGYRGPGRESESMYVRETRSTLDGRAVQTYRWNRPTDGWMKPIESGDWAAYEAGLARSSRLAQDDLAPAWDCH